MALDQCCESILRLVACELHQQIQVVRCHLLKDIVAGPINPTKSFAAVVGVALRDSRKRLPARAFSAGLVESVRDLGGTCGTLSFLKENQPPILRIRRASSTFARNLPLIHLQSGRGRHCRTTQERNWSSRMGTHCRDKAHSLLVLQSWSRDGYRNSPVGKQAPARKLSVPRSHEHSVGTTPFRSGNRKTK
jgi:hypothetical protein